MAPISVAVIGCGPGGMFFCHALETLQRQKQREEEEGTDLDLQVTCFEKASSPGGVWRSAAWDAPTTTTTTTTTTNMYAELWTNGPSHCTEFGDYTYQEHFGRPVTVYLPRAELLGYLLGRVTRHCPDFFEKYVQFDCTVERVVYDATRSCFHLTVLHRGVRSTHDFDRCIWAAGDNGQQHVPAASLQLLRDGGFRGRVVHSADTEHLEQHVRGQRILLLGGGYSAEDLALQAIKLGVKQVYICSRDYTAPVSYTKSWPLNKVKVMLYQTLTGVSKQGRVLEFQTVEWQWPDQYVVTDTDTIATRLWDIDTIILCTGYRVQMDMLDPSLQWKSPQPEHLPQISSDWVMSENRWTDRIGPVPPSRHIRYSCSSLRPELFRGVLLSNPQMMFVTPYGAHHPLLALNASAWLLAGLVAGTVPLPSVDEMVRLNQEQAEREMNLPYLRYYMDEAYNKAANAMFTELDNADQYDESMDIWWAMVDEHTTYAMKLLARDMQYGKYPWCIGTYEELNDKGQALLDLDLASYYHRANIRPRDIKEQPWKTFRDYDDADKFYSLFTGTKAVPLERHWLDIKVEKEQDGDEERLIEGKKSG